MRVKFNDTLLAISVKMQSLVMRQEGQDLIEYALLVAMIAFAATAGMKTVATDINAAFTNIGSAVVSYTI